MLHRVQVIHHFPPWLFAEIVDAGDIKQVIERKLIATDFGDFDNIICDDRESCFAAKFSFVLKLALERFFQRLEQFFRGHCDGELKVILSEAESWNLGAKPARISR